MWKVRVEDKLRQEAFGENHGGFLEDLCLFDGHGSLPRLVGTSLNILLRKQKGMRKSQNSSKNANVDSKGCWLCPVLKTISPSTDQMLSDFF